MYEIEKGILPTKRERNRYPFKEMSCGESFFAAVTGVDATRLRLAAIAYGRYHGTVFITRKRIEDGVTGIRVWMLGTRAPADGRDSVDGMGDDPDAT